MAKKLKKTIQNDSASKEISINPGLVKKLLNKKTSKRNTKSEESKIKTTISAKQLDKNAELDKNEQKQEENTEEESQESFPAPQLEQPIKRTSPVLEEVFGSQEIIQDTNLEESLTGVETKEGSGSLQPYQSRNNFYGTNNNYEPGADKYSANQKKYSSETQPTNHLQENDRNQITNTFAEPNLRRTEQLQRVQKDQKDNVSQTDFSREISKYQENADPHLRKKKEERIQTFLN